MTVARDAPLGGQAVIEGVMMRGVKHWAVALRKPTAMGTTASGRGEVVVHRFQFRNRPRIRALSKIPLLRGVIALAISLGIGFRALNLAASTQLGEEAEDFPSGLWYAIVAVALVFSVGVFFVLPLTLVNLVRHQLGSPVLFWIVEGALRSALFLGYMVAIGRMPDLRRTFEYHGAEHKAISCYEAGDELTPERAALYSRFHPRCGTSFLLVVMIVSIFVFAAAGMHAWWLLALTRAVGLPVVVGLSFEVIRWFGRNRERRWVQVMMAPGLALQRLTTREPSSDQLEVAITALNAVLEYELPGALSAEDLLGVELVA
ncbi:MAG: DUF1385 domain-containing protein [Solirubrobacteraceae bacterium]